MGQGKQALKNQTALITGASQGIGYALAKNLAGRGCNLFLVSLPGENLEEKSRTLSKMFNVRVDFLETRLDEKENCKKLLEDIVAKSIPVNILVNNAGIGSAGIFESFELDFYERQMHVNVLAVVYLTHLFLPILTREKSAYILNLSSFGAFFHMPHKEVYIASKAFVLSFSKSLYNRFRDTGLQVSALCPGPVNTNPRLFETNGKLSGMARKTVMEPDEVACFAIDGMLQGKSVIIPGRFNQLLLLTNRLVPDFIRNFLIRREMNKISDIS